VRHRASRGKKTGLGMGDLQLCASSCNAYCLTRNEQVSGSSPFVGSLLGLDKTNTRDRVSSRFGAEGFLIPLSLRRLARTLRFLCNPPLGRVAWQFSVASSSHEQLPAPTASRQMLISDGDIGCHLGGALDGDALLLRTAGTWSHSSNPHGKSAPGWLRRIRRRGPDPSG